MSRLEQLISELHEIGAEPTHRNAIQIFKILDSNAGLFKAKIDPDYFEPIHKTFEGLSNSSAREFNSPDFKRDYQRGFENLQFHINRVI